MTDSSQGLLQGIIRTFLEGKLAVLLIILSIVAGVIALNVTPREEEPQIVVPLADIFVQVPGASAREVERQVTTRLEKVLSEIDGVEYVYSMSEPNQAIVTVRFYVGEDREDSLIKLYNKLEMNRDAVPSTVTGWVVKPVEIDDVPIVAITLYAKEESVTDIELRRAAEELDTRLKRVENSAATYIIGGRQRIVGIAPDPERLAGRGLSISHLERALRGANVRMPAGSFQQRNEEVLVDAGMTFRSAEEVAGLVVGVNNDLPVYLRDVADVKLTHEEVETYTSFGLGPAAEDGDKPGQRHAAVTLAIAKKKGSNAVWVSEALQEELGEHAAEWLPESIGYHIARDMGHTADEKVNELVEALGVAIIIVIGLIALTLGWREGIIVAFAVPITFALTLLVNYAAGYTINRVTLFALILALGLVVDDPIVDVENVYRHFKMRKQKPFEAVLTAINEVRPPIILATLAVIVSFLPMFFITGMMGPYMRPMALNVPLAMLMSMVVAFTITPWMCYKLLRSEYGKENDEAGATASVGEDGGSEAEAYDLHKTVLYRVYSTIMRPLLERRLAAWGLIGIVVVLFLIALALPAAGLVPLKMLPFDNKNEFQVIVDMPEGTTLEETAAATDAMADYLQSLAETTDVSTYVGTSSPMDFNGMVRHYYLRRGPNVADIRVNLLGKRSREQQSHEIMLRIRHDMARLAEAYGANIKLIQPPPGPPVISTLTVEVYGQPFHEYSEVQRVADIVEQRFHGTEGVVDIDTTLEAEQTKWVFVTDKEKAALAGLDTTDIAHAMAAAVDGIDVTTLHDPDEVTPTPLRIRLPRADRADIHRLRNLYVAARGRPQQRDVPPMVQLGELGAFRKTVQDQTIYRKNLRPVAYVFAETAGVTPAEAIIDMYPDLRPGVASDSGKPLVPEGFEVVWAGEGEWKITLEVFRDLGLAFGAACLGIYILLVYETRSYFMPLILMISIPLTMIGIMPGFWLLNLLWDQPIGPPGGQFDNPVFFTATAMIGMIALSGIAVRNAILLIDFIHAALKQGSSLKQAILDSGAIRFRAIFLTAGTAMLAAWPITLDPIFSGLAWSLIFGLFVSTAFTLLLIPTVYWMIYRKAQPEVEG